MRMYARGLAAIACVVALTMASAASSAPSILHIRPGVADAETSARIAAINQQWMDAHPGQTPGKKAEFRPEGSAILWRYYRGQGFFPNWVTAARDVGRRQRAGEAGNARAAVDEIVASGTRREAPDGTVFRVNESVYLSTDGTAPPWRDAMGQGLILTTLIPTLDEHSTPEDRERIRMLATEYLNSFAVDWRDGGVGTDGKAGGRWFLEYATPRGDESRILNGFMQSIVSLNLFATQADALAKDDPGWADLRDRAREDVRLAALEVDAHLDAYDLRNGLSRYSMRSTDPAPETYQVYHRQLLQRLQAVDYLPARWRDHFDRMRASWSGEDVSSGGGWRWMLVAVAAALVVLAAMRARARRLRTRLRRTRLADREAPPTGEV